MNDQTLLPLKKISHRYRPLFLLALLFLLAAGRALAQDGSRNPLDGYTPSGLQPGALVGSYALSGFDTVNPYSGNMSFNLPLLKIGGRGTAGYTIGLPIEQKWTVTHSSVNDGSGHQLDFYDPEFNAWINGTRAGYGPGVLYGRQAGAYYQYCPNSDSYMPSHTLTRFTFVTSDGTEYELRDVLNDGKPWQALGLCPSAGGGRGRVFKTADGSSATFISDEPIVDEVFISTGVIGAGGYLLLRDGTRYRIDGGLVTWMSDRNGNKLTFEYGGLGVTSIKDSLNRVVTIEYGVNDEVPYGLCDRITYKGFGGATRVIRISYKALNEVFRAGSSAQTLHELFPQINNASSYSFAGDAVMISAVWLPDDGTNHRSYKFKYNSYVELARVELPTGAAFEYDWAGGYNNGPASGAVCYDCSIYRRVTERRVYADGVNLESRMTFSKPDTLSGGLVQSEDFIEVKQYDSASTLKSAERHYYYGHAWQSVLPNEPVSYPSWQEGKEYQTEALDSNGSTVLGRTSSVWDSTPSPTWLNGQPSNPRVTETSTTLEPNGANKVSRQTFSYDQYNNQTDVYEYDYGAGMPGGLLRYSHTDYLTTNGNIAYDAVNPSTSAPNASATVHVRNLPIQQSVYGGGIQRALTTFEYDNYTPETGNFHAGILPRVSISGLCDGTSQNCPGSPNFSDQNYSPRGNLTKVSRYLLDPSGHPLASVNSYSQYDVAGNVVKLIDPRSTASNLIATSIEFSDRFGAPNGEARLNSAPLELSSVGQVSYAFPTLITNAANHTFYSQLDYYLGLPVDAEDPNGVVSSGYFNDPLDRPKQVRHAVGTSLENQTTFDYDDVNRVITSSSDLNTNNDNVRMSKVLYDKMGRTIETRQYEGGTNYIAIRQEYDALGRPYRSSNPYRPWKNENAIWTTSAFDALGRGTSVTTPDTAIVRTAYSGNQVLVTDQTEKQRMSRIDASGQLTDVWEITAQDSATEAISFPGHTEVAAGYHTSYAYDALGDLKTVSQGSQSRTFVYDSLKRLTSATNPESGTVCYGTVINEQCQANGYDANGNLKYKTDARGILTTYIYDSLNRNTGVTYTNDPASTPTVNRYYDGWREGVNNNIPNSKGRLWQTETSGAAGSRTTIDNFDSMGRPLVQRQQFYFNSTWSQSFTVQRTPYNLAGGVTTQTYPSENTIAYGYDDAGRTNSFTGKLGDGVQRNYATEIIYSATGGMAKEKFGTNTPLYNKLWYNSRGQLAEIRVSTSYGGAWDTSWNRGAIINHYSNQCWGVCAGQSMPDNNGNLKKQEHEIPDANDQPSSSQVYLQTYGYDDLNRLHSVDETKWVNGNPTATTNQIFDYDRYGNRKGGINIKPFSVNPNNNRVAVPSGQSGTMHYDDAGNLDIDTYSGFAVARAYDAENRLTSETQASSFIRYTYNADGQRVRRKIGDVETWQVYGFDGELVAEYGANTAPAAPQKEYGYRNGQLLVTVDAPPPSMNGYAYRRTVTLDHTKIPNTDQSNFPMLISGTYSYLATTANGGNVQSANGYDVIFTSDSGCSTKLNHEVDSYNATNGAVNYWVKVPTVSHSSDTTLYMCYGNSAITTGQSNRNGVWDSNYRGVYHLNDQAANTTVTDSTVNGSHGTNAANTSGKSTGAQIGQGLNYNGSTDNTISGVNQEKSFTWECWFKLTDWTTQSGSYNYSALMASSYSAGGALWMLWKDSGWVVQFAMDNGGSITTGTNSISPGGWHHAVYSRTGDNGTYSLYLDGVLKGQISGGVTSVTGPITFAQRADYPSQAFNGVLDEARISNAARSADWIKTEYNNQSSPSTFYAISAASGAPSAASIQWLVSDQLGTPRMVFDQTGSLANMKRHDYLPFGEDVPGNFRTGTPGYATMDNVRQKFTQKERDIETGLDYFNARYYGSTQGRFTSPDPLLSSGMVADPQSWNRYSYVLNNPLGLIDPHGLYVFDSSVREEQRNKFKTGLAQAKSNLEKIAKFYGADSKEYKKAERAVNVYGAENVKNGVTIFATDNPNASPGLTQVAGVAGQKTVNNPTGQDIRITFRSDAIDAADLISHEGSHGADGSDWVASGFANAKNPTEYQLEFDGFTVSSLQAQARRDNAGKITQIIGGWHQDPGMNPWIPLIMTWWNSGWKEAERATMRANNINSYLERPKDIGGYNLSPSKPGTPAFLKGSRRFK